jgi:hypothetical protein
MHNDSLCLQQPERQGVITLLLQLWEETGLALASALSAQTVAIIHPIPITRAPQPGASGSHL